MYVSHQRSRRHAPPTMATRWPGAMVRSSDWRMGLCFRIGYAKEMLRKTIYCGVVVVWLWLLLCVCFVSVDRVVWRGVHTYVSMRMNTSINTPLISP